MIFLPLLLKVVIGLVFGSFIAALTYRYPRNLSNTHGRSFCDRCKKQIRWHDNIPVISFLVLSGKCRDCGQTISFRYPLIELATALGFVLIGFDIIALILFAVLEIIFIIDLEHRIIPDFFVYIGLAVVLLTANSIPLAGLLAGFICASFLLMIYLITRGRGMGLGDVKFAVLGGLIVGFPLSPIWLLVAFLTGAAAGIILILGKRASLKSKIAFGPFLVISIPITLVWGQKIIALMALH